MCEGFTNRGLSYGYLPKHGILSFKKEGFRVEILLCIPNALSPDTATCVYIHTYTHILNPSSTYDIGWVGNHQQMPQELAGKNARRLNVL